jgi:hypothetical protein
VHDLREVLICPVSACKSNERKTRRQKSPVRQVVDRGHELFSRKITGNTKEHQSTGARDSVEPAVFNNAKRIVAGRNINWSHG